jgi:hypothetical protein
MLIEKSSQEIIRDPETTRLRGDMLPNKLKTHYFKVIPMKGWICQLN